MEIQKEDELNLIVSTPIKKIPKIFRGVTSENKYPNRRKRERRETNWRIKGVKNIDGLQFTFKDLKALKEIFRNKCAICRSENLTKKDFHLDHNHQTKKARGILCGRCNVMLGMAKDNVTTLRRAIKYLVYYGEDNE